MFTKFLIGKMDKKSQQQQSNAKSKMAALETAVAKQNQLSPAGNATITTTNTTTKYMTNTTGSVKSTIISTKTTTLHSGAAAKGNRQHPADAEPPAMPVSVHTSKSNSTRQNYSAGNNTLASATAAANMPPTSKPALMQMASVQSAGNRYYSATTSRLTTTGHNSSHNQNQNQGHNQSYNQSHNQAVNPSAGHGHNQGKSKVVSMPPNNVTVLTQMQRAPVNANEALRYSHQNVIKELSAMHARSMHAHDKNEEALRDLQESIPEIGKIFDVHCRIGSGTFSTVLLGTLQRERVLPEEQRRRFAIKHHNPTNHPERILRELECMFKIGGMDNVIGINCCIRYNDNVAFVMPYLNHDRFHDIYRHMNVMEVKDYLRNLLIALRHVHRFNVIHRDVKPSNILYNRHTRQFLLCDFGLAQHIAEDGTVIQATDLSTAAATMLMRDMDTARQLMQGTTYQAEAAAQLALNKEQENARRMRAMGGGGGVDRQLDALPYNVSALGQRRLHYLGNLTKKDQAAQKADTMRLINRLRFMSSDVDPNNYVVTTNTTRKEMHASRAGTPGYRPPEVLLRYPIQSTAVDIWAAGVILLTLLSTLHPFFKAPNDCAALSEIINLFGDLSVRKTAYMLERLVLLTQKVEALDLRRVCMRFRYADYFLAPEMQRRHRRADGTVEMCRNCEQPSYNCICKQSTFETEHYDGLDIFPHTIYDLLSRLLEVNPQKRITADEALKHPFFSEHHRIVADIPIQHKSMHIAKVAQVQTQFTQQTGQLTQPLPIQLPLNESIPPASARPIKSYTNQTPGHDPDP